MNWSGLISSAVVATIVSGTVALLTSERRLAAENVIKERKNWLNTSASLLRKCTGPSYVANPIQINSARFALRLNPNDPNDQEILALIAPGDDAIRAD